MTGLPSRRALLLGTAATLVPATPEYSFHVFGLLKPQRLLLTVAPKTRAIVTIGAETLTLEGFQSFELTSTLPPIRLSGRGGAPVYFSLEAPSLLKRLYFGTLAVNCDGGHLIPIVTMNAETATSSIVGAELPVSEALLEALAAQAIVARSFLFGERRRHHDWDFCDTTHCQFLRAPAASGSAAARATAHTKGVTLRSAGQTISARYSAACGGHTDNKREPSYLYQSIRCEICERAGFTRRGHGLGLCQEGAMGLARLGWSRSRILAKYFPGSELG